MTCLWVRRPTPRLGCIGGTLDQPLARQELGSHLGSGTDARASSIPAVCGMLSRTHWFFRSRARLESPPRSVFRIRPEGCVRADSPAQPNITNQDKRGAQHELPGHARLTQLPGGRAYPRRRTGRVFLTKSLANLVPRTGEAPRGTPRRRTSSSSGTDGPLPARDRSAPPGGCRCPGRPTEGRHPGGRSLDSSCER